MYGILKCFGAVLRCKVLQRLRKCFSAGCDRAERRAENSGSRAPGRSPAAARKSRVRRFSGGVRVPGHAGRKPGGRAEALPHKATGFQSSSWTAGPLRQGRSPAPHSGKPQTDCWRSRGVGYPEFRLDVCPYSDLVSFLYSRLHQRQDKHLNLQALCINNCFKRLGIGRGRSLAPRVRAVAQRGGPLSDRGETGSREARRRLVPEWAGLS